MGEKVVRIVLCPTPACGKASTSCLRKLPGSLDLSGICWSARPDRSPTSSAQAVCVRSHRSTRPKRNGALIAKASRTAMSRLVGFTRARASRLPASSPATIAGAAIGMSRGFAPQTSTVTAPQTSPASAQATSSCMPNLTAATSMSAAGKTGTGTHARGLRERGQDPWRPQPAARTVG